MSWGFSSKENSPPSPSAKSASPWFATLSASLALPFFCRGIALASRGILSACRGLRFFCRVKLFSCRVLLSVSHGILKFCRGMLFSIPVVVKVCHGTLFFCHGYLFSTTYAKLTYPPANAGQKTTLFIQTAKYAKYPKFLRTATRTGQSWNVFPFSRILWISRLLPGFRFLLTPIY